MATFNALVTKTITLVRQVPGQSVQTYSEGLIGVHINSVFNFLWDKAWWPEYMKWMEKTLDETTGVVSADLLTGDEVAKWKDIRAIFPDDSSRAIPLLPGNVNPYSLSGTKPLYVSPIERGASNQATRLFKVWPVTAEGDVAIHLRVKPTTTFSEDDEILFDEEMMAYAAAWMYLKDDGSVDAMVDEYKGLFDQRFKDITMGHMNQPVEYNQTSSYPGQGGVPDEWFVR